MWHNMLPVLIIYLPMTFTIENGKLKVENEKEGQNEQGNLKSKIIKSKIHNIPLSAKL